MKKTYIVIKGESSYLFRSGDVPQDHIAPLADVRYPSNYKKLVNYTLNWQTRNIMEASSVPTLFVTFTYDDVHYVENRLLGDIKSTLKDDWQRYAKRLRRSLEYHGYNIPFKYYAITERGDDGRLHFHALLYGFEHTTFKSRNKKGQMIDMVNFSPITDIIDNSWGQGFVYFESACPENVRYVTKYLHKRKVSPDYISLKSNGIGLSYLTEARVKHFQESETAEFHINGRLYFMPRYIKGKVFSDEQRQRINDKIAAVSFLKKFDKIKVLAKNTSDNIDGLNDNRHYVYHLDNPERIKKLLSNEYSLLSRLDEEKLEALHHLSFNYDSVTDNLVLCFEEINALRFAQLRDRYLDNLRMKSVFNRRL